MVHIIKEGIIDYARWKNLSFIGFHEDAQSLFLFPFSSGPKVGATIRLIRSLCRLCQTASIWASLQHHIRVRMPEKAALSASVQRATEVAASERAQLDCIFSDFP